MISKHVCSEEGEEKIDETDLPTAKEITLTAEELQFINNAEEYEELQVAGSQKCNKKTALSLSRGSVGAAVVGIFNVASIILFDAGISVLCLTGGVVGGVALGVVGAVAVGGGAAYLACVLNCETFKDSHV